TVKKLESETPNIDWENMFDNLGVNIDTVQVGQPKFFTSLSKLVQSTPVSVWKNYLKFHLISGYASWLSSPFADASFAFRQVLTGQKQKEQRWKRASNLVNGALGDALGKLYVKRY